MVEGVSYLLHRLILGEQGKVDVASDQNHAFDWSYAKEFREWATDLDEQLKELRFRLRELTPKHSQ